jgi:Rieske 2Fe-2S family protein
MPRETHHTLDGRDYVAAAVYEVERDRLFAKEWSYAFREELLAEAGAFRTVEVGGESLIVIRGRDGELHAHVNVCRHRGARLCEQESGVTKGAIKCPYHAWAYAHDGALIGTPNVGVEEIDRASLSLWPAAVDVWEGFVFVNLDADAPPLRDWLGAQLDPPLRFDRFDLGALRIGRRTVSEVEANWKILIDNYHECLHCPTVHPELVAIVPTYRLGAVIDASRPDGGVALAEGGTSFTHSGRSVHPILPGMTEQEANSYFGAVVFPNMFIDVTGTSAIATSLVPRSATHTTIITEYLFTADEVADPAFDPSDVVDFSELVARQDYDVCERVQRGVSSRAFTRGVLAEKDDMIHRYNARYLELRGPVDDSLR